MIGGPAVGRRLQQRGRVESLGSKGCCAAQDERQKEALHFFTAWSVWRYASTLCMSASVYFGSSAAWASSGSSIVNFTSLVRHDRYHPSASFRAIVNSSR